MAAFAQIPLGIGIPAGLAAIAAMYAVMRKAPKVKDAFAPSSRGPFTITDNYGGMARTTPGDNMQVGPSIGAKAAAAPVIIQNSISPFAMANSGKPRRGLGGIQELQASPTMA